MGFCSVLKLKRTWIFMLLLIHSLKRFVQPRSPKADFNEFDPQRRLRLRTHCRWCSRGKYIFKPNHICRRCRFQLVDPQQTVWISHIILFQAEYLCSSMYFTKSAGKKREIEYPLEQEVKSAGDCGRSCVQEGWSYFNYKQQGGLCQLPSVSIHSDVITSDADWDHYEEDPCTFY